MTAPRGILLLLPALALTSCRSGTKSDRSLLQVGVPTPICTATGNQSSPAVSGNTVVWMDCRNGEYHLAPGRGAVNPDTYGRDLGTGKEFPICTDRGDQHGPAISGAIVVWRDDRRGNPDIYGYDLAKHSEFPVCTDPLPTPAVAASFASFLTRFPVAEERSTATTRWAVDPAPQSGATVRPVLSLSIAEHTQACPAVAGKTVVWQDNRNGTFDWDIFGCDLGTGRRFSVSRRGRAQQCPAIHGNTVVWDESSADILRPTHSSIQGYDLQTGRQFPVAEGAAHQEDPAIWGSTAVWLQCDPRHLDLDDPRDIRGCDLRTKQPFTVCSGTATWGRPAVCGDVVVWCDNRNGNWDIYGYDLRTKQEFPIATTPDREGEPAISGDMVVWCVWPNDKEEEADIWGMRLPPRATSAAR